MSKYKLSIEAEQDMKAIYKYGLEKFGVKQADKYYYELHARFERAAESPLLYPSVEHIAEGLRRSVCGVSSIYYRVNDESIEIMAIIGQQDFS